MTIDGAHPWHDHDAVAAVFRALAEPHRLQMVHSLAAGERRVTDLVAEIGLAQSTISVHLGVLRSAGLVEVRTQGRSSYYSLTTSALVDLVHHAEALLDQGLAVVVHEHETLPPAAAPTGPPADAPTGQEPTEPAASLQPRNPQRGTSRKVGR